MWGEKGETDAATTATNIVFENYRVQYKDNTGSTKNSTVSNTTGWDYVGIAPYAETDAANPTKVVPTIYKDNTTKQTIQYWDFGKAYTFTAVSALSADIDAGRVKITKNYTNDQKTTHGYTIELTNGASAANIFVSDRLEKEYATGTTSVQPVILSFRQFQTKIRFGFYETVPGYNVQITGVKYGTNTQTAATDKFGVDGNFIKNPEANSSDKITYTVIYESGNDGAKPVLSTTQTVTTPKTSESFGGNIFTAADKNLGTVPSSPLYDLADGKYSSILPNTENTTDMTFKVSYKLISEDTQEVIEITDKTVTVPAQYCQWKPNFAYTYLFKVSDQSADLYPITFDAVVAEDEVSKQETITEVGEPSITTFAVSGSKYITGKDEYESGNTIYATVMEGSSVVTLTSGAETNGVNLYVVETTNTGKATITEAAVANLIAHTTETNKIRSLTDVNGYVLKSTKQDIKAEDLLNVVPSEDGKTVTLDASDKKALKWTAGTAGTYYAVEYVKDSTHKYYKIVKVAAQ